MMLLKLGLPLKLLAVIILSLIAGPYLPIAGKSFLLSLSLTIKEALVFFLPFIIFSYLFSCILSFRHGVISFVFLLLLLVCTSNFISAHVAYGLALYSLKILPSTLCPSFSGEGELLPLWSLAFKPIVPNDYALLAGVLLGGIFSYFPQPRILSLAEKLKHWSTFALNRVFIPIIPLFILGFLLKLQHEGALGHLFRLFGPLVIIVLVSMGVYVVLFFGCSVGFSLSRWLSALKTALPSGLMGFSTMSSAASLPLTIKAAERNTGQSSIAQAVVPSTVNIHLVGDSLSVPMMAIAVMTSFGFVMPDYSTYFTFVIYFILAKFTIAAVPAGGIIVMIPIMEKYLGFSPEMSCVMTAIYVLLDPFNTSANVLGNGAFAILFSRIWTKIKEMRGT